VAGSHVFRLNRGRETAAPRAARESGKENDARKRRKKKSIGVRGRKKEKEGSKGSLSLLCGQLRRQDEEDPQGSFKGGKGVLHVWR